MAMRGWGYQSISLLTIPHQMQNLVECLLLSGKALATGISWKEHLLSVLTQQMETLVCI